MKNSTHVYRYILIALINKINSQHFNAYRLNLVYTMFTILRLYRGEILETNGYVVLNKI